MFKINDFESQLSENDINLLNKSLTKAVDRIENKQEEITNTDANVDKSSDLDSSDLINNNFKTKKSKINTDTESKPKSIDVDIHNMKIDRDVFYKFKNNSTHEFNH